MVNLNRDILDKVLISLDLTTEKILKEGLFDGIKNLVGGSSAMTQAANNLNSSIPANPNSNLKVPTLQTMTTLKNTAQGLEKQAQAKQVITGQEAGGMFKQFNDQLLAGGKAVQAAAGGRQPVPPQPTAPAQPNAQTAPLTTQTPPTNTPTGLGIQQDGTPNISQDFSKRPPLLQPWINPQGQFVELTPEQAKTLTPEQQTEYMSEVIKQRPKPIQPPPQANAQTTAFTNQSPAANTPAGLGIQQQQQLATQQANAKQAIANSNITSGKVYYGPLSYLKN